MLALQFATPGFQPHAHLCHNLFGWRACASLLKSQPSGIRAGVKFSLHAPVLHGLPDRGLKEVGQRFAFAQHVLEVGPQLGLNTHLRKDGSLHAGIVLQTCCIVKETDQNNLSVLALRGADAGPLPEALRATTVQV